MPTNFDKTFALHLWSDLTLGSFKSISYTSFYIIFFETFRLKLFCCFKFQMLAYVYSKESQAFYPQNQTSNPLQNWKCKLLPSLSLVTVLIVYFTLGKLTSIPIIHLEVLLVSFIILDILENPNNHIIIRFLTWNNNVSNSR